MIISCNTLVDLARENIKEIDVNQLKDVLGQGICLIDVREPAEFVCGHVAGMVNMPRGVLEMKLSTHPSLNGEPLTDDIVIYLICRSGGRSALAAQSLQGMGFKKVYSVAGGMIDWEKAGLEIQR
jgi:rhodanese-related sulfurtransferase